MTSCDRCNLAGEFLFHCDGCGGLFCSEHHDSDNHHCSLFGEFYSEGEPTSSSPTDPDPSTPRYADRARKLAPAAVWVLAMVVLHHFDVHPDSWGIVAVALVGSIALWKTAISIPTVNEWVYSGG